MSIKISHFDLNEGENLIIRFGGNAENAIAILWKHDQLPIIKGPMNCNTRSYTISTKYGMLPIPEDNAT